MLNKIQNIFFEKSSLTMPKIYRYFLYLGFLGLLSTLGLLVLDWVLYPQYITAILNDAQPHVIGNYRNLLVLLHGMDTLNLLLIGLGFFAVFGRNVVKGRYIFLLLFLFPIYGIISPVSFMPGGYLLFYTNLTWVITENIPIILISFISSYILYNSRHQISENKLALYVSIMLVLVQLIPFIQYFFFDTLSLHYDYSLSMTVGTLTGTLIIIGTKQLLVVVSLIFIGLLFRRELGKFEIQSKDSAIGEQDLHETEEAITILNEPILEQKIYRFFMVLGLVSFISMITVYIFELFIYPQYIHTMFTEGLIPSFLYNSQLNLVHSMDPVLTLCISLGFLGIFAKYGKKSGYIFLLIFIFPINIFQQYLGEFLIGITSIEESLIWYISAMGLEIAKSVVLAFLLYRTLGYIIDKKIIGLTSLTLVISQVAQVVWYFSTRHLAPVYDFSNIDITLWTVEGTIENAMFIVIPRIWGAIVCAIIFAALFLFEIRKEKKSVEEHLRQLEVIENTPKEIVISRQ